MANSLMDSLRAVRFLNEVPDRFLESLVPAAQMVALPAGALVFRHGDTAASTYLVVEGEVALEICAPAVGCKRILTIGPGELLGWAPVLRQPRMTATARVLADLLAIRLDSQKVLEICDSEPRFGYEFMKRTALALAKRLNATRLQLLDVYGSQLPAVPEEDRRD